MPFVAVVPAERGLTGPIDLDERGIGEGSALLARREGAGLTPSIRARATQAAASRTAERTIRKVERGCEV